jgi:penicillin-binding protein 1A
MMELNYRRLIYYVWIVFLTTIAAFFLFIGSVRGNWFNLWGGMPDFKVASELWSEDGVLLGKYFRENRVSAEYKEISPNMINALKATEDIRFEEHSGIDFVATLAIIPSLMMGQKRGSSTLTQQLAKNLFRTRSYKGVISGLPIFGTVAAKMKEWILAIELEKSYTKTEIITMYLNTVDFGSNSFGVKVAARTFFNTEADQLSIPQAALLVGLLKGPSLYSPVSNPKNALDRRNTVIKQLYKYDYITLQEYNKFIEEPLGVDIDRVKKQSREEENTGIATYFRSVVGNQLRNWCAENGYDLYADGLRIYTTINAKMQQYAEEAVVKHMTEQQKIFFEHWKGRNPWVDEDMRELPNFLENIIKRTDRYKYLVEEYGKDTATINKILHAKPDKPFKVFTWENPTFEKDTILSFYDSIRYYKHFLHLGMMSMDPHSGHIKAWVGGINHKYFKYDHVKQGARQPGSTFKPMIYATALYEKGFHPCDKVIDAPVTFINHAGDVWTPKNSDGYSNQIITLRQAIAQSINTIAAFLIKDLSEGDVTGEKGSKKIVEFAYEKLGFKNKLDPVPSLCLGTSDVSVYELTGAYSAFVNRGVWTEPIFLLRIEDRQGKILHQFVPKTVEAMNENIAYTMVYMLRGATEEKNGTAQGLWKYEFRKNNEVAGKTGTTSNYSDAWFVGMTKDLVTGVWTGGEDRSIHFRSIQYGQGAKQAMPAFAYYTDKVFADSTLGYKKGAFPKPTGFDVQLDCKSYYNKEMLNSDIDSIGGTRYQKKTQQPDDIF